MAKLLFLVLFCITLKVAYSEKDCYDGVDKKFIKSPHTKTKSGLKCQRWDSHTPWNLTKTSAKFKSNFPDKSIKAAENFCRNPDMSRRPYCYTTSKKVKKEYCDYDVCKEFKNCYFEDFQTYKGKLSTTKSGATCLNWDSATVKNSTKRDWTYRMYKFFPDASIKAAKNYCRQPIGKHKGLFQPWCFTGLNKWEVCNVKKCKEKCRPLEKNVYYIYSWKDIIKHTSKSSKGKKRQRKSMSVKVKDRKACVELCQKTDTCNSWMYWSKTVRFRKYQSMCYLLKKHYKRMPYKGVTSGYKTVCE